VPPRGKFKLNKGTAKHILQDDDDVAEAVDDAAQEVADRSGPTATVDTYKTDRHVAGVTVAGAAQARDGVATRAAQAVSAENAGNARMRGGLRSRAQWRYLAANDPAAFRQATRASVRYSALPERVQRD